MGTLQRWYDERVLPRCIDRLCSARGLATLRHEVLCECHGEVVEIGFGSGTNVPCYPPQVQRVAAVEPSAAAVRLAAGRIAAAPCAIEIVGPDGQALPLADASMDCAVSTFTLCTVPDPALALQELRRVLRPGGTLHVLEHGLADRSRVRRVQRCFEPVQRRLAGGCHLTRDVAGLLAEAGFEVVTSRRWYESRPHALAAMTLTIVRSPLS